MANVCECGSLVDCGMVEVHDEIHESELLMNRFLRFPCGIDCLNGRQRSDSEVGKAERLMKCRPEGKAGRRFFT